MIAIHTIAFYLHVTLGAFALVIFWLPVAVRKGGPWHKRAGRWFANSMYAIAVSGFLMSILVLIDPIGIRYPGEELATADGFERAGRIRMFSTFLLMLSVLVFASVRHSLLALRAKQDRSLLRRSSHLALLTTLGALGLLVAILGLQQGTLLLIIFGALSASASIGMFRYSFKKTLTRNEWWIEHMANIIGAGIGAYTAFFAFGGSRLFGDLFRGQLVVIPWILPSVIGVGFIVYLGRHYRRKFAPRATAS